MAPVIAQLLVVLMMMPAIYNGIASSLHMEIVPSVLDNRISDEVKINCVANESPNWTGDVIFFQLSKKGEHPIATVKKAKLIHGRGWKANMEAEGNLNEENITESFLTLTMKNPGMNDAGLYSCHLFYMDGFGELKEGQVYGNFTINNDNDKLVIHLVKSLKSQEAKVTSLEKIVKDQEKQLQEQTKHSKEQDAKVSSKISELSQKEHINYELIQNITDQESFVSAFSAGYDAKDTITRGNTLVFSQSILDVGHDYDTSTGVYTAPRRGLYLFTLVVATNGFNRQIKIHLQANGHTVATLFARDNDNVDQSSVSTVVSLQAGDKARPVVDYISGANIIFPGDHLSVFSGCFLQPL